MSNYAKALNEFQKNLPFIEKKAKNPYHGSSYATLEDITRVVMPLLAEHGLVFTVTPTIQESGQAVIRGHLFYAGDDWESPSGGEYATLPLPDGNPQQQGSALTYARRYLLCAMTGVAPGGEDDDGNAASLSQPPQVDVKKALKQVKSAGNMTVLTALYNEFSVDGTLGQYPEVMDALNARREALSENA